MISNIYTLAITATVAGTWVPAKRWRNDYRIARELGTAKVELQAKTSF